MFTSVIFPKKIPSNMNNSSNVSREAQNDIIRNDKAKLNKICIFYLRNIENMIINNEKYEKLLGPINIGIIETILLDIKVLEMDLLKDNYGRRLAIFSSQQNKLNLIYMENILKIHNVIKTALDFNNDIIQNHRLSYTSRILDELRINNKELNDQIYISSSIFLSNILKYLNRIIDNKDLIPIKDEFRKIQSELMVNFKIEPSKKSKAMIPNNLKLALENIESIKGNISSGNLQKLNFIPPITFNDKIKKFCFKCLQCFKPNIFAE